MCVILGGSATEVAVARLGSDQCERGRAARRGSSMGGRAAPVASSSRFMILSLFSLFLSPAMTPSRCSLSSLTLCLLRSLMGAASDLALERQGATSGLRPSSACPVASPLSPPRGLPSHPSIYVVWINLWMSWYVMCWTLLLCVVRIDLWMSWFVIYGWVDLWYMNCFLDELLDWAAVAASEHGGGRVSEHAPASMVVVFLFKAYHRRVKYRLW